MSTPGAPNPEPSDSPPQPPAGDSPQPPPGYPLGHLRRLGTPHRRRRTRLRLRRTRSRRHPPPGYGQQTPGYPASPRPPSLPPGYAPSGYAMTPGYGVHPGPKPPTNLVWAIPPRCSAACPWDRLHRVRGPGELEVGCGRLSRGPAREHERTHRGARLGGGRCGAHRRARCRGCVQPGRDVQPMTAAAGSWTCATNLRCDEVRAHATTRPGRGPHPGVAAAASTLEAPGGLA
jgi:hypothetical protein